ncbi:Zinc finger c2h2-type protein [Lasiodiplodia theobromae]|uniref:Zinc finger c2h2-type protein n=1 Tax=Lasiodiplodia theobromae TaxID=45133 RepID=UPI0015C3FE1D|nr:Zinc finger c2h2-type protein [Lasiodiplodia theobromae]KAF4544368.1 Zinc finger c2h2-type protein [Lasiodiplodia theobromae]
MKEQDAQQQQSLPPQQKQQQQQHKEQDILSQLQEMHGAHPGTFQATINAEQPADVLRNIDTDIELEKLNIPDLGAVGRAFENGKEPFIEEHYGIEESVLAYAPRYNAVIRQFHYPFYLDSTIARHDLFLLYTI